MRFEEDLSNPQAWYGLTFNEPEWACLAAEYGTHYWRRKGTTWVKHSNSERGRDSFVLFEDVQDWLYANVGHAHNDYWCVDRSYYRESDLPDLKVDWDETFLQPTQSQRNWRVNPNVQRLLFRQKDHAMLFKLTYHGIEGGTQ